MVKYIWVLFYLINRILSEEVYQNSSHICSTCICEDVDSFILDCNNKHLENVLANWPTHNKSLIATFSYNNITTLKKFPITQHAAKLVFDHCNIQYLESGMFSNIKRIEYLDLSHNLLTTEEISRDNFKGPYDNKRYRPIAIKHLNLAYNNIHSIPQKFFDIMPDLEELNLEGNDFVVLDPSTQVALGSLGKIKVLNLANNELTELEANFIRNLNTLTELDLSSNHLDFVPITLNYISKNLKILKLSNNYIFQLTDQSFIGLDLMELYLNDLSRLKVVEANTFATQKNLKKLYISGNPSLRVIDKEAFANNQTLDELDLSNNALTDINYMLNWSKLKILKINSNLLECTCELYTITKALPKSITRTSESPMCTYEYEQINQRVYSLDAEICSKKHSSRITKITKKFNIIRIVMIILCSVLITITGAAAAVAILRYRKRLAFRNYPFAAQVSYLPIQTQHI
ncbi:unnamed protein product [Psylliodes chrysocephalus]|uniref:Uncharacterized protein n=1 Tax=Psylliodes chrysocephalus TaxID=3402493 RepID=A0A9P0G602_9CUCU|nr:unnamed protein product [Psylliodes chrysocephala]